MSYWSFAFTFLLFQTETPNILAFAPGYSISSTTSVERSRSLDLISSYLDSLTDVKKIPDPPTIPIPSISMDKSTGGKKDSDISDDLSTEITNILALAPGRSTFSTTSVERNRSPGMISSYLDSLSDKKKIPDLASYSPSSIEMVECSVEENKSDVDLITKTPKILAFSRGLSPLSTESLERSRSSDMIASYLDSLSGKKIPDPPLNPAPSLAMVESSVGKNESNISDDISTETPKISGFTPVQTTLLTTSVERSRSAAMISSYLDSVSDTQKNPELAANSPSSTGLVESSVGEKENKSSDEVSTEQPKASISAPGHTTLSTPSVDRRRAPGMIASYLDSLSDTTKIPDLALIPPPSVAMVESSGAKKGSDISDGLSTEKPKMLAFAPGHSTLSPNSVDRSRSLGMFSSYLDSLSDKKKIPDLVSNPPPSNDARAKSSVGEIGSDISDDVSTETQITIASATDPTTPVDRSSSTDKVPFYGTKTTKKKVPAPDNPGIQTPKEMALAPDNSQLSQQQEQAINRKTQKEKALAPDNLQVSKQREQAIKRKALDNENSEEESNSGEIACWMGYLLVGLIILATIISQFPEYLPAFFNQWPVEMQAPIIPSPVELQSTINSSPVELQAPIIPSPVELQATINSSPVELQAPIIQSPVELQVPIIPSPVELQAPIIPSPVELQAPIIPSPVELQAPIIPSPHELQAPVIPLADEVQTQIIPLADEIKAPPCICR